MKNCRAICVTQKTSRTTTTTDRQYDYNTPLCRGVKLENKLVLCAEREHFYDFLIFALNMFVKSLMQYNFGEGALRTLPDTLPLDPSLIYMIKSFIACETMCLPTNMLIKSIHLCYSDHTLIKLIVLLTNMNMLLTLSPRYSCFLYSAQQYNLP